MSNRPKHKKPKVKRRYKLEGEDRFKALLARLEADVQKGLAVNDS